MKTKKNIAIILFVATLMLPLISNSQNLSFREDPKPQKVGWQPIKLDDKGSNLQNGVEFYIQKGNCPYGIIALLKFANTNNYPVKVSYQVSAESPIIEVTVPASKTLEGSCETIDGSFSKLLIKLPEAADEKNKTKQYLSTHIFVTKN